MGWSYWSSVHHGLRNLLKSWLPDALEPDISVQGVPDAYRALMEARLVENEEGHWLFAINRSGFDWEVTIRPRGYEAITATVVIQDSEQKTRQQRHASWEIIPDFLAFRPDSKLQVRHDTTSIKDNCQTATVGLRCSCRTMVPSASGSNPMTDHRQHGGRAFAVQFPGNARAESLHVITSGRCAMVARMGLMPAITCMPSFRLQPPTPTDGQYCLRKRAICLPRT